MKIFLLFVVFFTLFSSRSHVAASCYSAIYSFGDSLADTGNLLLSHPSLFKEIANLPYGETYFDKPTGRCSDGRLVVDYIGMNVPTVFMKMFVDFLSHGLNRFLFFL